MADKKMMFFGIWAVIAIAAIVLLVLIVMRYDSPVGAFSASNVFGEDLEPTAVCEANGCEYVGHIFPQPNFGPGRVDCLCNGEIATFQLVGSDIETAYSYYP